MHTACLLSWRQCGVVHRIAKPRLACDARLHSRLGPRQRAVSCQQGATHFRRLLSCSATSQQTLEASRSGSQQANKAALLRRQQIHTSTQPGKMEAPSGLHRVPMVWTNDRIATADGVPVLDSVSSAISKSGVSAADGGMLVSLTSPSGFSSMVDVTLGKVRCKRFVALARNKLWWMTPEWGISMDTLPPETQFLLLELEAAGQYALILPLIEDTFRATLRPIKSSAGRDGAVTLRMESGDEGVLGKRWEAALYIGAGTDPYELINQGVAAAAQLSGTSKPLHEKELPASLDLFGWCTWDAFYSTVSARGVQEGLGSFEQGGLQPRFVIIDDGWQMTDVDEPYRKAPTGQLVEQMQLPAGAAELPELLNTTEQDFFNSGASVLAEQASLIPPQGGTPSGTLMPTVQQMGTVPHPSRHGKSDSGAASAPGSNGAEQQQGAPAAEAQPLLRKPAVVVRKEDAIWIVRMLQKLAGWLAGMGAAAFLIFYQWVVEPAPPGSLPVRFFEWAAQGPLRGAMLSFYAGAADFTRRLTSVKANSKFSHADAGPEDDGSGREEDLRSVVAHVKNRFNVDYVYCWHGLPAYWGGVMPASPGMLPLSARILFPKPTPGLQEIEPSMAWNPAVLAGVGVVDQPLVLYTMMHGYLRSAGVDGVKVDCQAGVGLIGSAVGGGPAVSRSFHAGLEQSIEHHFPGNHCINCMCHSTENVYRWANTAVARASDDFFPRDLASSTPHIAACAFNSAFIGALAMPDWDMFHSQHPAARLHAAARAVSGGAIYVSDKPGQQDFALLRELVLPDGSVLRAKLPGRPTRDTLFADPLRDARSVLKVWNVNSYGGIVGVFNLQGASWDRDKRKFHMHDKSPKELRASVRPADVEPFSGASSSRQPAGSPCGRYACYAYNSRDLQVLHSHEAMQLVVPAGAAELVAVSPVLQAGDVCFCPVALTGMFNGGAAVLGCCEEQQPEGGAASFAVQVRGCGELLMYASREPSAVMLRGGQQLGFSYTGANSKLLVEVPQLQGLAAELLVVFQ